MNERAEIIGKTGLYTVLFKGETVGEPASSLESAMAKANHAERRAAQAMRACLICSTDFLSWGIGNRICPGCVTEMRKDHDDAA